MIDQFYARLYEIRNVADENIEEYQNLFQKMYDNRDATTFRKLCSVLIDESPYGNTSIIHSMWREYIEGYYGSIPQYISELLKNSDTFIPNGKELLQMSLIRILNAKIYEKDFLEIANKMYYEKNPNYKIIKTIINDFRNGEFYIEEIDRVFEKLS